MNRVVTLKAETAEFLRGCQQAALGEAMTAARAELSAAAVMPYNTGFLEDAATFADVSAIGEDTAELVSDAAYAANAYFHPEYNFRRDRNANAGAAWFERYQSGEKAGFIQEQYADALRRRLGNK